MRTPSDSRLQRQSAKRPASDLLPSAALSEGTPGRILVTALRLFAQRGFHGTSVRALAAQCELQPGALYVHFPSKEHILAELARLGHEAQQTALRTALLEAGDDPAEQLVAVVKSNATLHATYPQLAIVVNEDVTKLKEVEEQLRRALHSREEVLGIVAQLAGGEPACEMRPNFVAS